MDRIRQAHVSSAMGFFKPNFLKRFNLAQYEYTDLPTIIYGMYNAKDLSILNNHKTPLKVVWCGSDAMNPSTLASVKGRVDVEHIATSTFIKKDLDNAGIPSILLPIFVFDTTGLKPSRLGDCIYWYGITRPDFYMKDIVDYVESKTKIKVIRTHSSTFKRGDLIKAYEESFIGLRLTPHDGLAMTVIEMGLMGRGCVFNGNTPNAINWTDKDSVLQIVDNSYKNRTKVNPVAISDSVKEYLNIGEGWLYL